LLFGGTRLCHRGGTYDSVVTFTRERPVQKRLKRCNCMARLRITCLISRPDVFALYAIDQHAEHTPGDRLTRSSTLPLARRILHRIDEQLASFRHPSRDICAIIFRHMDRFGRPSKRRDNYNDVYNNMRNACLYFLFYSMR
ncbi:hypothetical protein K501DRAFT_190323, partial [Backusella circina FSU 941]